LLVKGGWPAASITFALSFFLSFFPIWALVLQLTWGVLFPFQFVAGAGSYYDWW
jgi:hypothetical protein